MTVKIEFDKQTKVFHLKNNFISYLLQIDEGGIISHIYFGKTIKSYSNHKKYPRFSGNSSRSMPTNAHRPYSKEILPQEFSSHGSIDYRIQASVLERENGSNLHDYRYYSHKIQKGKINLEGLPQVYIEKDSEAETLILTLKDQYQEIYIDLIYTVFNDYAAITRSVKVRNLTNKEIIINKISSMQLDIVNNQIFDEVLFLPGAHMRERQIQREKITEGIKTFSSRRGASSHQMNNFISLLNHDTNEFAGPAIGLTLVYSGNYSFEIEKDQIKQLRVLAGINSDNFSWHLEASEEFQTPEAIIVYSDQGLNQMSKTFHNLLRERVSRGKYRNKERPILVNNWEATYFDFNSEKIEKIVDEASRLGIEMFVLDDGWFGKRDKSDSSLGDWFEYEGKLTKGLKGLADYVHNKGLKFGLWFEPEMISIDSELYRNHPDYLMQEPGRTPTPSRNQHVLDMGRREVRDVIEKQIRDILDSVDIDYIKWDMNRSLSDIYSIALSSDRQGETGHRYILGVYDLLEKLTSSYPEILWEGCAGGGGRFDAGLLYYMPQSWTSDNTDPVERMKIQYGTSLIYPISAITAHVSASPNHQTGRETSLKTRGDVAKSGVFGYELNLAMMTNQEKVEIQEQITQYRQIRSLVQFGDFIRLKSPFDGNSVAWMFVSKDQKEALVFLGRILTNAQPALNEVRLAGLKEDFIYEDVETSAQYFGDELMRMGIYFPNFYGDFQTEMIHLKSVENR